MKKIRIAIIGYGGIARVHNSAYAELLRQGYPVELVAVCERDPARVTATLDFNLGTDNTPLPNGIKIYNDIDKLIEEERFDAADICLPTFLHKDVAIKLLLAGKHVMCEKPMALSAEDALEMLETARQVGKRLMIAHCVRFDPAYKYLKTLVDDGSFGALQCLYLDRHSVYPTWGAGNTFADNSKTGGCTLDTHIHDIDVASYVLGEAKIVSCVEFINIPYYQVVTSTLKYGDTTVVANCSWDSAYTTVFWAGYRARFERASVTLSDGKVTVYPINEEPYTVDFTDQNATVAEIKEFLDSVKDPTRVDLICPPEASYASVKLVEELRRAARR
ncbi:MAG: Gfo/Idh/MocA family oxidoreductase [Clostridia bacterium]|nr:Gfo/Idh/MocA family oxidoreductase [Clostridia bacterium]